MFGDQVAAADLEPVEPEFPGQLIHRAFDGETGLRPAATAIGRYLHGRGVDRLELDEDVRNPVRAGDRRGSDLRHRDAVGDECPGVVQEEIAQSDHLAGFQRRQLDGVDLGSLLRGTDKVFAAVLDVFHRHPELHRRHRHQQFVGIEQQHLLPKTAANVGRDDADLVLVDPEHRGETAAHRDRRLRPVPHRQLAGHRIPSRRHGAALHRRRGRAIDLHGDPGDVLGDHEGSVRIA